MYTIFLPEVAVNTETGKVTVEKFTCVADVGTIMNRLLVEGNFYGGLVQGVGLALTEDFEDLNHDTTLKNCGIPYPKDAPDDIELHFNETIVQAVLMELPAVVRLHWMLLILQS